MGAALIGELRDSLEGLFLFAGLSGFVTTLYKFWVPAQTHARHHDALVGFFGWASRGGWLEAMQAGVGWFLNLLSKIYGPPAAAARLSLGQFLTVRSWRMSAWIAALTLFVVGPLLLIVATAMRSGIEAWQWLWLGMVAAAFAALLFALKKIRVNDVGSSWVAAVRRLLNGTAWLVVGGLISAVFFLGTMEFDHHAPDVWRVVAPYLGYVVIFAGIAVTVILTIAAIAQFGFSAALALIVQLSLATAMLVGIFLVSLILLFAIRDFSATMEIIGGWGALQWTAVGFYVVGVLAAGLFVFAVFAKVSVQLPAAATLASVAAVSVGLYLDALSNTAEATDARILPHVAAAVFGYVVPVLFTLYTLIAANSLPDWLSIALTRRALTQAATATNPLVFAMWLVIDLITVIACILLTAVILLGGAWVSGLLLLNAGALAEWSAANTRAAARYFLIDASALQAFGRQESENPGAAGISMILILTVWGGLSILPTLLNAAVICCLLLGRLLLVVVRPPLTWLHSLLLAPQGATLEQAAASYGRSAAVFGFLGALAYTLVFQVIPRAN